METTSTMTRTRTRQVTVATLADLTRNKNIVTDWDDVEDVIRFVKTVHRDVVKKSLQEQSRAYRDEMRQGRDVYLRQRRRRRRGGGVVGGGGRQARSALWKRTTETSEQTRWKRLPAFDDDVKYEKEVMDRLSLYCCLPCGDVTPSTACLALTANAPKTKRKKESSSSSCASSSMCRFRITSTPSPAFAMASKSKRASNAHSVSGAAGSKVTKNAKGTHPARSVSIPCRYLEGCHLPLPRSFSTVFLQSAFAVDDQKSLKYVPYFGDDDREDVVSELYSTKHRERLLEYGPEYYEEAVNEAMDHVIAAALQRATAAAGEDIFFGRDVSAIEATKEAAWLDGNGLTASQNEDSIGTATTEMTSDDVIVLDGEDDDQSIVMETGDGDVTQLEEAMQQIRQPPPWQSQEDHDSQVRKDSLETSREESPDRSHDDSDEDNSSDDTSKRMAKERQKQRRDSQVWKRGLEDSRSRRCVVLIHCIAQVMHLDFERVYERFRRIADAASSADVPAPTKIVPPTAKTAATNSEEGPRNYLEAMDSYRNLFCRQCFSYDCNIHGNIKKPSLELQTRTALEKAQTGHWLTNAPTGVESTTALPTNREVPGEVEKSSSNGSFLHPGIAMNGNGTTMNTDPRSSEPPAAAPLPDEVVSLASPTGPRMTALDRSITGHLFEIFQGDVNNMAQAMGCGVGDLSSFVAERSLTLMHKSNPAPAKEDGPAANATDADVTHAESSETSLAAKVPWNPVPHQKQRSGNSGAANQSTNGNSSAVNNSSSCAGGSHAAVSAATVSANNNNATSMKNYNASWLRRVQNKEIRPAFVPCNHDGPCSAEESQCSCFANLNFCTKHCACAMTCANTSKIFFRGCACKAGSCTKVSCSCFAARRECDPDLCRSCGACTDPPNRPAVRQRCRNDNIGMRRHAHLLLAESNIKDAGWGIFTKGPLKRGDFVHEYLGEVISQEEAERRGWIYDKVNRSYLFNLSSDYVVDASRKGNKTKFANHSPRPNCVTRMVTVNGDARVGLFAKENIPAQSELYFDYRYDVGMDNELILKPGMTVAWMKDPKMANKISVRTKHHQHSSSSSVAASRMDVGMTSYRAREHHKNSKPKSQRASSSSSSKKRKR